MVGPLKRPLLALLIAILAGCSKEQPPPPPAAVPVTVAPVRQEDVPVEIHAIGNVEAYKTVTIKPRVSGQLAEVHIEEGQEVHTGQPIFTLDPRPFQAAVEQAQATLDRDVALALNAERQAERQAELFKQKLISPADYEQARAQADAAKATAEADKAAKKNADLQLAYCYIAAPIDGIAGSLMVDAGNNVKVDDTAMLTINQVHPIDVSFSVPEQYLAQIQSVAVGAASADRLRLPAETSGSRPAKAAPTTASTLTTLHPSTQPNVLVQIPPDTQHPETGTLVFVDNQVDASTGTIRLKAEFLNTNLRLWPGQFVQVTLIVATEPHAIVIPSQAIQPGQQGSFVFVVKEDLTVEAKDVVPGRSLDGRTIIKQGLSAGQRVVTDGQVRLVPGAKVEIQTAATRPG